MKSLLEKNKEFIIFLNRLQSCDRRKILSHLGGEYINTIAEIFQNFLQQNLTRDPSIIKKVKSHSKQVKLVTLKSLPIYQKKKILQSKQGGALLSLLLPLATSLITGLINRKR